MTKNPSYDQVAVGDTYTSALQYAGGQAWFYTSHVLKVHDASMRFGKIDRIVTVEIQSSSGNIIDKNKLLWVSDLLAGLV